ncbi:hypothetical protein [Allopontixanthobacter sediminis]|uniref:Uncharacterized protein n=1 Tax=Allopontixanthobacter sediminis TaxID=1689985 RepID=A0A845B5D2_9SPHN|nr:hypothetical protein [Allopontixanthobacter sediminis]MXP45354.1 hypothetical protein [Allopontixanthobacter sediminis]
MKKNDIQRWLIIEEWKVSNVTTMHEIRRSMDKMTGKAEKWTNSFVHLTFRNGANP